MINAFSPIHSFVIIALKNNVKMHILIAPLEVGHKYCNN
jgi:hypothetical protein